MMILFLFAAAVTTPPPVVVSSLQTGQLVENCRGKDNDPAATFCTGYILGVFDALSLSHEICIGPDQSSTIKAVAAARRYLRTHRKKWSNAPAFVVRDALRASFPCTRG